MSAHQENSHPSVYYSEIAGKREEEPQNNSLERTKPLSSLPICGSN